MLRSISFMILLVLLVEPFLTFFNNQKINKEIDIYVDNSKSIAQGISIESLESYVDSIRSWGDSRDYSTNLYLFGEGLRKDGSIDLSESSTRYDHVVKRINSRSNHLNIILTDGQQTHGFRLSDLDINSPVNIVGLGESSVEDISIENVTVPVLANSGDSISVTIYISSNLSSKAIPLLQLKNKETILYSKNIDLSSGDNRYQYDLMIQAPDSYSGEFYLDASIIEVSFPENRLNNEFKTQIIIKDESKSTLIVTGSLSPNTQAINTVVNDIPDLETSKLYKVSNKWSQPIESFDFSSISVFIYDNFPLSRSDLEIYKKIEKDRGEDSKVIFIEGPSYDFNTLNKILLENKYSLSNIVGLDLFPMTHHIESVASFKKI